MNLLQLSFMAVVLAWISVSTSVAAQTDETERLVKREQLKCVLDHLQTYSASDEDPVIIYLSICPKTTMTRDGTSSEDSLPTLGAGEITPVENVLVVLKSELPCLAAYRSLADDNSQDIVRVRTPICSQ
jgi:hypothetical protein